MGDRPASPAPEFPLSPKRRLKSTRNIANVRARPVKTTPNNQIHPRRRSSEGDRVIQSRYCKPTGSALAAGSRSERVAVSAATEAAHLAEHSDDDREPDELPHEVGEPLERIDLLRNAVADRRRKVEELEHLA